MCFLSAESSWPLLPRRPCSAEIRCGCLNSSLTIFLIFLKHTIKDTLIHIPWWFCHSGPPPPPPTYTHTHRALSRQTVCILSWQPTELKHITFCSLAKSTVMNLHTCCCFLSSPAADAKNISDSEAVQDIFHRADFPPQNHSIKCHLCPKGTYGEANAVLLYNLTHFYLEITSSALHWRKCQGETDFILPNWH